MIVVVMGVSGCGKTTVGRLLAQRLGWCFYEGDDFHSAANIEKMSKGIPLTDADRWPWLADIRSVIESSSASGTNTVIACSALRQAYRSYLSANAPEIRFVYLKGSTPLIVERMSSRESHYMKSQLLDSQIASLEEPVDAIEVDIRKSPDVIVAQIETQIDRGDEIRG